MYHMLGLFGELIKAIPLNIHFYKPIDLLKKAILAFFPKGTPAGTEL